MIKDNEKIIVVKKFDKELYNLLSRIETTEFGNFYFDGKPVKEINVKGNKPKMITVEETICLDRD